MKIRMPSVASAPTGWTIRVGFVTLVLFAFAYGVCYGATIAPRPAVIADHFAGPDLAAVTGLHYTSSVLGSLVGPAGVRLFGRLLGTAI
jgi:MFS family permease